MQYCMYRCDTLLCCLSTEMMEFTQLSRLCSMGVSRCVVGVLPGNHNVPMRLAS